MKKSIIMIFLVITVAFAAFVGGYYYGRHSAGGNVIISGVPQITPTTTASTATVPTGDHFPTTSAALMININTATLEQLDLLPGIGPVTAQAIIDYRTEFGPFETPEDLLNVKGIGEKKLAAILEFITTGG